MCIRDSPSIREFDCCWLAKMYDLERVYSWDQLTTASYKQESHEHRHRQFRKWTITTDNNSKKFLWQRNHPSHSCVTLVFKMTMFMSTRTPSISMPWLFSLLKLAACPWKTRHTWFIRLSIRSLESQVELHLPLGERLFSQNLISSPKVAGL